jgi:hypothetical protein
MALKLKKTLSKGIVANECYAKILEIKYYKNNEMEEDGTRIMVGFYYDKEARDSDPRNFIEVKDYILTDVSQETRDDQYKFLKSIDEFSGAEDV